MAPADARSAGCYFMKECRGGMVPIPRLHAGAVLAGELAGTAYTHNPDSDVPTPSAPALPFPSDNTGGKPHWAFQISAHKWFILPV